MKGENKGLRWKMKGSKAKEENPKVKGEQKVQIVLRERWIKCEEGKKDYVGEIKSHKSEGGNQKLREKRRCRWC